MLGNLLGNTQVVGFATTMQAVDANEILSIQPIFFSNDLKICSCLNGHPTMSRDTVRISELDPEETYLNKLAREGKLDTFVNFTVSLIVFVVIIAILVGILCYFSRKQIHKVQMSFEAKVYIDLAAKVEQRNETMKACLDDVQKNGYTPKPKVIPADLNNMVEGEASNITIEIPAQVSPGKVSSRSRAGKNVAPSAGFESSANTANNESTSKLTQKLKANNELVSHSLIYKYFRQV